MDLLSGTSQGDEQRHPNERDSQARACYPHIEACFPHINAY